MRTTVGVCILDEERTRRTIGGPRKVCVQVVFVPASSLVIATQDIGRKRVHGTSAARGARVWS